MTSRFIEYPVWQVFAELAVIWAIVYVIFRFVRGTRAAGALKGILLILLIASLFVRTLNEFDLLPRLAELYSTFLGLAAVVLIVTFQPELRRAFIRLGEANFLSSQVGQTHAVVDPIVEAATFLAKNKFGALIALERNVGLREAADTGVKLNADISASLLNNIFWPSSPLHDMGVLVRRGRIIAASVPFPLVEPWELPDQRLGTRHRAAMGLARNTDALVVVVSEETGAISLAEGRTLTRWLTPENLRTELIKRLSTTNEEAATIIEDTTGNDQSDALADALDDTNSAEEDARA
ncbi:MAG: diadenylate cyclase [Planctomycetota bacterium]